MKSQEKKESYVVARTTSLKHALRGIAVFVRITPNFWVHFLTLVLLVVLGVIFKISAVSWIFIIFANGLVIGSEAFNSAIEIDMDLTNPGQHPMVRDTKDIAAGAVLIFGVVAWIVDLFVFLPPVIKLLKS